MIKKINGYKGYFISDAGKVYSNLGRGNRNKNKRRNNESRYFKTRG